MGRHPVVPAALFDQQLRGAQVKILALVGRQVGVYGAAHDGMNEAEGLLLGEDLHVQE